MRSVIFCGLAASAVAASVGCVVPIYSSNPDYRARRIDQHVGRPASHSGDLGPNLVPRYAGHRHSLSYTRRRDLGSHT